MYSTFFQTLLNCFKALSLIFIVLSLSFKNQMCFTAAPRMPKILHEEHSLLNMNAMYSERIVQDTLSFAAAKEFMHNIVKWWGYAQNSATRLFNIVFNYSKVLIEAIHNYFAIQGIEIILTHCHCYFSFDCVEAQAL